MTASILQDTKCQEQRKGGRNHDRALLVLRAGLFLLVFAAIVLYMFLLRTWVYLGSFCRCDLIVGLEVGRKKLGFVHVACMLNLNG